MGIHAVVQGPYRISALRIILRVKRKRSEVIPAPVIDYSDLSESFCSIRLRRFRS